MATKKIAQTVITEDKFYTISAANGLLVEVFNSSDANGAKIQLWENVNAECQQWSFVRAGDGVYRIKNRSTGKMLDLSCGGIGDGTRVHQCQCIQPSLDRGAGQRRPREDQVQSGRQVPGRGWYEY